MFRRIIDRLAHRGLLARHLRDGRNVSRRPGERSACLGGVA